MSAALKEKLKRIENDLGALTTKKAEVNTKLEAAKKAYGESQEDGIDGPLFKAAEEVRGEWGAIEDGIRDKTREQIGVLRLLGDGGDPDNPVNDRRPDPDGKRRGKADLGDGGSDRWSAKAMWERHEGIQEILTKAASSSGRFGSIDMGQVADREALKADIVGTDNLRRGDSAGVVAQPRRRLSVLDLMPVGTTNGDSVPYVQETGTYGAAETTEGTKKPEDGLQLVDAKADVETIAAWLKIRKQALSDAPMLQSIIDTRLRYSVRRRLEGQCLVGDGASPNLRGIMETTGTQAVPYAAGPIADLILTGITKVMLADGEADGVVLQPEDWQQVLTAKGSDGHYLAGGPFSPIPPSIWGVNLLGSAAMTKGTGLVGDFGMGAMLFIREGVNVLLSDSDQDDFVTNRVTMLGEMRAALAVWVPGMFAELDFTA
jgi:hypothetical protein